MSDSSSRNGERHAASRRARCAEHRSRARGRRDRAPLCPCDQPTPACARVPTGSRPSHPLTLASRHGPPPNSPAPRPRRHQPLASTGTAGPRTASLSQIERYRPQRPGRDVDQMAALHVARVDSHRGRGSWTLRAGRSSAAIVRVIAAPPVCAVIVKRTARPPGRTSGHK